MWDHCFVCAMEKLQQKEEEGGKEEEEESLKRSLQECPQIPSLLYPAPSLRPSSNLESIHPTGSTPHSPFYTSGFPDFLET